VKQIIYTQQSNISYNLSNHMLINYCSKLLTCSTFHLEKLQQLM